MVTELQAIAEAMTSDDFGFYYGEKAWQNLIADDTTFPLISVDFIPTVEFSLGVSGYIGETYPLSIYFGYKSELDWTTIEHEEVIESAKTAAREFISRLQKYSDANGNKLFDSISFVKADRVILRPNDDVGTSGVLLALNVKKNVNYSVCTD